MRTRILVITLTLLGLTQCDRAVQNLGNRIPHADPKLYRNVSTAEDWKNPYLIVQADGIELVQRNARMRWVVSVDGVASALQALPNSAWPYGLVVAVQDTGVQTREATPRIAKNREMLLEVLNKLGIAVNGWPSA